MSVGNHNTRILDQSDVSFMVINDGLLATIESWVILVVMSLTEVELPIVLPIIPLHDPDSLVLASELFLDSAQPP
ncbi:hypothetical protein MUK42_26942 [Musa troglodytarum]|uniref:Uncharacterized protein n=1 Tax=Musa troglodytarum TaxID=320322 RepID=A0A9E7JVV8_9LILI|nr:hypothetical protein MUK42_26942 [Musa troglodytarum]